MNMNDVKAIWFRSNTELVDANDDATMLALVRDAQAGNETATAGVLLAMESRMWGLAKKFRSIDGKGSGGARGDTYEACEQDAHGWVASSMALAVASYDLGDTDKVAYRLFVATRYILRAPGRRVTPSLLIDNDSAERVPIETQLEESVDPTLFGIDDWLRAQLWEHARGRESNERFAAVVEAIVEVWLHEKSYAEAAENAGIGVDSLKFYLKRSTAALATEEFRQVLLAG